ncbi:hypothetical protein KI387_042868, partial [Taxus chinensis]
GQLAAAQAQIGVLQGQLAQAQVQAQVQPQAPPQAPAQPQAPPQAPAPPQAQAPPQVQAQGVPAGQGPLLLGVGGPAPAAMVARARYMEVRAEARYYQDVLDGPGADYQPYAAHRAETSRSQRSQGAQPQPVGR